MLLFLDPNPPPGPRLSLSQRVLRLFVDIFWNARQGLSIYVMEWILYNIQSPEYVLHTMASSLPSPSIAYFLGPFLQSIAIGAMYVSRLWTSIIQQLMRTSAQILWHFLATRVLLSNQLWSGSSLDEVARCVHFVNNLVGSSSRWLIFHNLAL